MVSTALILKPSYGNEHHLKDAVPPVTSEMATISPVIRTRYNQTVWVGKHLIQASDAEIEESGIAVITTCCCELRMWITRCRREDIDHKLALVFGEDTNPVLVEVPYAEGLQAVNSFRCVHKAISTA
jgi:hypothetical protein